MAAPRNLVLPHLRFPGLKVRSELLEALGQLSPNQVSVVGWAILVKALPLSGIEAVEISPVSAEANGGHSPLLSEFGWALDRVALTLVEEVVLIDLLLRVGDHLVLEDGLLVGAVDLHGTLASSGQDFLDELSLL
eukprot:CAMPEP_0170507622 /NCGR_PEP_ID=MMETSP0208-20121228/59494_1 /TAXON_ID=197538 /ORGANISM="Strombidium inclinatum, Strain S3" /LENGTH=134 /DNA_ID=CAMNT_0010789935 /DNA_START=574 /DNA_END=975 /DNA_ORIENTATION=+